MEVLFFQMEILFFRRQILKHKFYQVFFAKYFQALFFQKVGLKNTHNISFYYAQTR